jgi:hypothetical protein
MFDIYASVAFYRILIALHLVGASVWIGGHLVLATTILPRALRNRDPAIILDFEKWALLTATLGLALNAKFRVIPNINRDNMHVLGSHIVLVTVMSVGFLLAGIAIRTGGLF